MFRECLKTKKAPFTPPPKLFSQNDNYSSIITYFSFANPLVVKKLLIIENDPDTLDVMADILEYNDFEVVESQKKMSLRQIEEIKPDIIVIDHLLDDGYGSDLCVAIKAGPRTKDIPVILCSASYKIEQIARDAGADTFLAKPFDLNEFLRQINELVL